MKTSSPYPSDEEWKVGIPHQRVSMLSEVTVASASDLRKSGLQKPLLSCEPPIDEARENKFQLVAIILGTLVAGIIIGFTVACLLLPALIAKGTLGDIQEQQQPYQMAPPPTAVPEAYYAAASFNNAALIPNLPTITAAAEKPQTFDACGFVVQSTDEVWNRRGNVEEAIEKYFHEDYVDAGSWGKRIIGKKELKQAVWSEMRAFPDIQIHITDCLCLGNDVDGYKCAMPDVLTGTNTGPSSYGPATGNRAKWTGLVQSLVKKDPKTGQWQYYAEWGVHDEWALIQQLGLDFSRVPHPDMNYEPLHDGEPLVSISRGQVSIDEYDVIKQHLHDAEKIPNA